ncbi:MAG: NHL repeat-containing protein, partial [Solirubrobacteraceae bacterium]
MRVRRAVTVGLCSVGLLAGGMVFSSAPALGFFVHPYLSKIAEANGSALGQPWQLTFDSGGNLLVPDAAGSVVDLFNSSDVFTGQLSFTGSFLRSVVVGATGDVYVGEIKSGQGIVDVLKPEGGGKYKLLQEKELVAGVEYLAIDNSSGPHRGEVYVIGNAVTSGIQVEVTDAEGKLVGPGTELPQPEEGYDFRTLIGGPAFEGDIAIDGATGTLYLANPGRGFVDEYNAAHVYQGHFSGPSGAFEPVALAVEESTGDLYVVDAANKVIDQFDASGKYIGRIAETPSGPLSTPDGVAVSSTGQVYVSDAGTAAVDVFGASVPTPEATTGAAGVVLSQRTAVKLEGVVNPEGEEVASCEFEYGTSTAYGQTAACTPAP